MGAHQIVPVITINPPPPATLSGCANSNFTITTNAAVTYNAQMSFQWMRNGSPLSEGVNGFTGTKTASLTMTNAQPSLHGGDYALSITASGGADPAITNIIAVTINAPIDIVKHPDSRILCRNNETSLSVVANGTILGYQWQKDGQNISGATGPIYATAAWMRARVSGATFSGVRSARLAVIIDTPARRATSAKRGGSAMRGTLGVAPDQ